MRGLRRSRRQSEAAGLLAGLLTVGLIGTAIAARSRYCGCVQIMSTVSALHRLSHDNWRTIDQTALTRMWPGVATVPCAPVAESGIAAFSAAIERCCSTCGTCGAPIFVNSDDGAAAGLRAVGVMLCRDTSEQALHDLRRLVEAAVPERPDAIREEHRWVPPVAADSSTNAYRWRSGDQTFIVEARAVRASGEWWLGLFELTRCRTVEAIEEWTLDDGSVIRVLRSEVEALPGDEIRLWFEYLSVCLMSDHECLDAESARLWPRVKALAEGHGASKVFVGAEDCTRSSRTVVAAREADGRWDTPWQ
jgi:hypothetical protein